MEPNENDEPSFGSRVDPGINGVQRTSQIRIIEFVLLRPSERGVSQSFLHHGMQPSQEEIDTRTLSRLCWHFLWWNAIQGSEHIGLDSCSRLINEDSTVSKQIDRQLRVNFSCQEQAESSMRCESMDSLLKLNKPLRRKVYVLQEHPTTRFGGRGNRTISLSESL